MTRSFVHQVSRHREHIPVFVLTDFDPDGLNIYRCYLCNSNLATNTEFYNSAISWLGIKSCHLIELGLAACTILNNTHQHFDDHAISSSIEAQGFASSCIQQDTICWLTMRDRKVIVETLKRVQQLPSPQQVVLQQELQRMQFIGYKAEIQCLDDAGDLTPWLNQQLNCLLYQIM